MNQVVEKPVDSSPGKKLKQPKLAYMVRESIEGHCVVVFAKSELQAKRLGATELDTTVDYIESAERCPEFDVYAEAGMVPPLVALEHNWWFECSHCGSRVTKNMEDDDGYPMQPVADGERVYCNQSHMMVDWRQRRSVRDREHAAIEACSIHFYGWPIFNLKGREYYGPMGRETILSCEFDFPGRKGMLARWNLGDGMVWISQFDQEAWDSIANARQNSRGSADRNAQKGC